MRGFCALTLLPGTVVSALLYPIALLSTAIDWLWTDGPTDYPVLSGLTGIGSVVVLFAGMAAMVLPAAVGSHRRGLKLGGMALLLPLHFLLVSLAAWLAVFELARHPHRWNKTEHGRSRSSHSGALHLRGSKIRRLKGPSEAPPPCPSAVAPG